jgi:large subunit ribosomal protein L1
MSKHSKRYNVASGDVGLGHYSAKDAVAKAKEHASSTFPEAVELHVATGADPRHADQQIREIAPLPHGTGKNVKVCVFADGDAANAAKDAGADYIVDDDLVKKIEGGWSDFDVAIATPDQMSKIGRLGRYLGRKGLMPNPRTGTVVQPDNIASAISSNKQGRAEIKLDKGANVHVRIGTVEFNADQILDNLTSVYGTLLRAKPDGIKGQFIKSATICTTMGPGIKLDLQEMEKIGVKES